MVFATITGEFRSSELAKLPVLNIIRGACGINHRFTGFGCMLKGWKGSKDELFSHYFWNK